MSEQFLYLTDPLTLTFETEIEQQITLPDGRQGVVLNRSYFYPTGGGQEHDTGALGAARVVDVLKSEDGSAVVHVLDGNPGTGKLQATIDRERRMRHMQHHTAQHLLSGCLQQVLNLETLSSGVHGYAPTTIDLPDSTLNRDDLYRIETMANQIVYENRKVKSYFVPAEEIDSVPLRRPPKVTGKIRIVEIDGFDYSACGATHCPQTGMIGTIKILRTERINQKTRLHFAAGIQAMTYFCQYQEIATTLAADLSAHPQDVVELIRKQSTQLHDAEKALRQLRLAYSAFEAQDLLASAVQAGEYKVIMKAFENRPVQEIRSLGSEFKEQAGVIALLATFDGKKIVLVASCGPETGFSARKLLNQHLASLGGRGGGDDQIAQGGGAASEDQYKMLFDDTLTFLLQNE